MKPLTDPLTEAERLAALRELELLDTPPDKRLDRITALARETFQTEMALVTLIDEHRQWFMSKQGIDGEETPREHAFCAHTIQNPGPMVVLDAQSDPRFAANPFVTGDPHVRFYAGAPIVLDGGAAIGALCVVDSHPREEFRTVERRVLVEMAELVTRQIEKLREGESSGEPSGEQSGEQSGKEMREAKKDGGQP